MSQEISSHNQPPREILRRHVFDLHDFTRTEIEEVLDTADSMKEVLAREISQVPALRGITVVNMFFEDSTRTRMSFELAARSLSANVMTFTSRGSSIQKGESLIDTVRTIQAMGANILVVRHSSSGVPYLVAEHFRGSVINAGDGCHAHPTQALLDLFTIYQKLKRLEGLNVVIVGDVLHSRVARSNLWGLTKVGANITLCAPPPLLGPTHHWHAYWPHVRICSTLDEALHNADVVMALRLQKERQQAGLITSLREYYRFFALTRERLENLANHVLIMHPGPMNVGVEITSEVATSKHSVIEEQVTNGVAIRMALLYRLSGR
jgi:aspartate carbamoyltransferase catalytic subunit